MFFILLRRHIFVCFTRIVSFLSLMRSLLIACCYLVAQLVGTTSAGEGIQGLMPPPVLANLYKEVTDC
jgi:hypothetical protein